MTTSPGDNEAPRRPDVFISYSRKDREFVKRLDAALQARGRGAWVDWEGIRPAEEFMQAIFPAIEGTDTFVFVISPDSVTSAVCGQELAHAASHNKRMVPIFAREVDVKAIPEALAKLNWVFFCRENEDFDVGTDTLISAIDTDLDWVHAHTRLLTRAIEWETKGKNSSFVLRGEDLRAAEQWLAQAGTEKERQPTTLQTEYIIASRRESSQRQRITLGAVTFGFVVAIILALLAYLSRQEAHRRLVGATIVAGQERVDRGDLFDALPYFVEALKLDVGDRLREPLHRIRLGATLRQVPELVEVYFYQNRIGTAELSSNGEWVLTTADAPVATLHRILDGEERQLKITDRVRAGAFSADGQYVVLQGIRSAAIPGMLTPVMGWESAGVQVWDVAKGVPISPLLNALTGDVALCADGQWLAGARGNDAIIWNLKGEQVMAFSHHAAVKAVTFDSQGTQLLVTTVADTATVWELPSGICKDLPPEGKAWRAWFSHTGKQVLVSGRRIWTLSDLTGVSLDTNRDIVHAAFSPDDKRVVVGSGAYPVVGDGSAQVFDVVTGHAVTPLLLHGEDVTCTAFSADGHLVATGSADRTARVWNAETGVPVTPPLRHLAAVTTVQFAGPTQPNVLLTASDDGTVRLWRIDGRREVTVTTPGSAWHCAFSSDGKRIALGGFDQATATGQASGLGLARMYTVDGAAASPPLGHQVPLSEVRFNSDGRRLITRDWNGSMFVWNGEGRSLATSYAPRAVDPDGNQIIEFGEGGRIFVRDINSGDTRELPGAVGATEAVFSLDGKRVALAGPTFAGLWNVATGEKVSYPVNGVNSVRSLSLSPEQRWLLLSGYSKPQMLDLKSGNSVTLDFSDVNVFSAGDKWLLNINNTGPLILWDLPDRRATELSAIGTPICAAFSLHGDQLVIGYQQNLARLWSPKKKLPLFNPLSHATAVNRVSFSNDGRMVATGSSSNQARVWDSASATALTPLLVHPPGGEIYGVKFSPDGGRLLTVSTDRTSKIWDLSPDERGVAELEALADFLAACRMDEGGGVVPLGKADLPRLYEQFRTSSPNKTKRTQ
jgi:WD40 repeat protein